MADYAQKARSTPERTVASPSSAVARARRTAPPSEPRAQAIAQLRRSISQSPRVAQLAEISAALQRRGHEAQGQLGTLQRVSPEEELQGKFIVQRAAPEEELLQGKTAGAAGPVAGGADTQPANMTGMPSHLKAGIESLSGMDLSAVRVHSNSPEPARLDAYAYAQGNDIHVAPGQERHLPHEAWHVVQQRQGRVRPTSQMKGVQVNDDRGLEAEADRMGAKAVQLTRQSPDGRES